MTSFFSRHAGFTLIEVLLSVAILTALGAFTASMYTSYKGSSDLDLTSSAIAQTMRRAQILSSTSGSSWGVRLDADVVTLFRGDNFESRDVKYDETYSVPNTVEVVRTEPSASYLYSATSGRPLYAGDFVLRDSANNTIITISSNEQGVISY